MVTTRARHSANKVINKKVQDHDDDSANKSPVANKKDSAQAPPDTVATLIVPTHMLAIQAEQLRAQLSVFPNGNRCPRGHFLLVEMNQELSKRDTK
jgi:hypothetical protein